MAKKPEPPKPTTWSIYKLAGKAVRFGNVEAPDEARRHCESRGGIQGARQQVDGGEAMTRCRC
jgi:hypothetical protein